MFAEAIIVILALILLRTRKAGITKISLYDQLVKIRNVNKNIEEDAIRTCRSIFFRLESFLSSDIMDLLLFFANRMAAHHKIK